MPDDLDSTYFLLAQVTIGFWTAAKREGGYGQPRPLPESATGCCVTFTETLSVWTTGFYSASA